MGRRPLPPEVREARRLEKEARIAERKAAKAIEPKVRSKLNLCPGDVISPKDAGRVQKRKLCQKLTPEQKALVWAPPKSNAGVGWITGQRWSNESSHPPAPTIRLDPATYDGAMLRPNQPRHGLPGAGYATFHTNFKEGK